MRNEIIVLGSGGHAKVVIASARALGYRVVAAYDDDPVKHGSSILGVTIVGAIESAASSTVPAVIAIGDNKARRDIAEKLALQWTTVVHPAAHVHDTVILGAGTVVFAGVVIQPDTEVGLHTVINTAASIDHDCRLGAYVHIAPGVRLAGEVTVGDGTLFGIGSCAMPQASVGSWATIGAGATVITDIASSTTAVGTPARALRG